jgi:hypothetical protein
MLMNSLTFSATTTDNSRSIIDERPIDWSTRITAMNGGGEEVSTMVLCEKEDRR